MGAKQRFGRQGSCGKCHAAGSRWRFRCSIPWSSLFCFFSLLFQSRVRDCSPASPLHLLCSWFLLKKGCVALRLSPRHLAAVIHFSLVYIHIYYFFTSTHLGTIRLCAVPFHSPFSRKNQGISAGSSSATHQFRQSQNNSAF